MKDRIKQIMESQHMTQQVFADFIGTTPATLSGIFNDRTRPTINIVEAIKRKIPDISTDWLLFGSGTMYRTADPATGAPKTDHPTQHQETSLFNQEPMINFGAGVPATPKMNAPATPYFNGVRNTHPEMMREDGKSIEKPQRRVTEIRVYYDDQTWESFSPSKK